MVKWDMMKGTRTFHLRRVRLGDPEPDVRASTSVSERVAMVWTLTQESWSLAGRQIPVYARKDAPVRVVSLGAT
jgi:hypothetical protein